MKSLVRKELLELVMIVTLPLLMLCGVFIGANRFESTLLAPNTGPILAVYGIGGFAGVLVAFFQFEGERRRGTLSYLLHRGTAHRGVFAAKVIAGLAGTTLFTMGPPLVYALWQLCLSPNGSILQWRRVVEMCEAGSFGVAVYSMSVLAAQLRRGVFLDLAVALLGGGGILLISLLPWVALGSGSNVFATLAVPHLVLAAGLLAVASRLFLRPRDRELPFAPAHHGILLAIAALVVLPAAALLVCGAQFWARSTLTGGQLAIVQDVETREIRTAPFATAFERDAQNRSKYAVLHQPGWRPLEDAEEAARLDAHRYGSERIGFEWERLTWGMNVNGSPRAAFTSQWYFDRGEGVVRMFVLAVDGRPSTPTDIAKMPSSVPAAIAFSKPDGTGRFSRSTQLGGGLGRSHLALADPEDGSLWRIDVTNFATPITKLALPDGDRFAGFVTTYSRTSLQHGVYSISDVLVRGEKGSYALEEDHFVRRTREGDQVSATAEEAPAFVEQRVVVTDPDPIEWTVEVRDAKQGTVLFAHRYEPETVREKSLAWIIQAGTLFGMPCGNVSSFLRAPDPRVRSAQDVRLFQEPLFAGRSRAGLFALGLALAAGMIVLVVRRLRAREANPLLIAAASLLVALFGVPAFLLVRALEPRGSTRQAQTGPELAVEPGLLIQSA